MSEQVKKDTTIKAYGTKDKGGQFQSASGEREKIVSPDESNIRSKSK